MKARVVFETQFLGLEGQYFRIVEHVDTDADMTDLKGDCFDFEKSGYTGTRDELRAEELEFEDLVRCEGVFGYELQKWNPLPGCGWEHVDSCFGFVGSYSHADKSDRFNHYIVDEMKETIKSLGGVA